MTNAASSEHAAVIGTGAWGLTLAMLLARNGVRTTLWARTADEAAILRTTHHHPTRLTDVRLPDDLRVTDDLAAAVAPAAVVLVVVPSQTMRANAERLAPHLSREAIVVSASKGIEIETSQRMTEVLAAALPMVPVERIGTLSGPNLAREIADGLPATTVVAAPEEAVAVRVQRLLMSATFRVYTHTDVTGVELGGVLKNIVALGAGLGDGLGLGDNAKAAFMTRGLAEIARLGVAAGAQALTFAGLAGVGDVVATCSSRFEPQSAHRGAAGAWCPAGDDSSPARRRCGGGADHARGADSRPPARRRNADRRVDVRGALRGQGPARCERRTDGPRPQARAGRVTCSGRLALVRPLVYVR